MDDEIFTNYWCRNLLVEKEMIRGWSCLLPASDVNLWTFKNARMDLMWPQVLLFQWTNHQMVASVKSTSKMYGEMFPIMTITAATPRYLKIVFCDFSQECSLKHTWINYSVDWSRQFKVLECYNGKLDKRRNDFTLIVVGTSVNYQKFNIFGWNA